MERRRGDDFVADGRQVPENGSDKSQAKTEEDQGASPEAKEVDYDDLAGNSPWGWPIGF